MEGVFKSLTLIRRKPVAHSGRTRGPGFTLVELVMVVTIIGIVAAIAVPRVSSASSNATRNSLDATLVNVRKAIDIFYAEHNRFPGYDPTNGLPDGDDFVRQLTLHSDSQGWTNGLPTAPYLFGPYLRTPFPLNPTNKLRTVYVKPTPGSADPADGSVGWVAVLSTGDFGVSATDTQLDSVGVKGVSKQLDVRGR